MMADSTESRSQIFTLEDQKTGQAQPKHAMQNWLCKSCGPWGQVLTLRILKDAPEKYLDLRGILQLAIAKNSNLNVRPKFFTPCLLFSCWTLAICLGTGQLQQRSQTDTANKIAPP